MNLRPYQTEARHKVNQLLNAGRHPVFVAPTGCIIGSSIINFNRATKGFKMSIEHAFYKFNQLGNTKGKGWDQNIKTYVRSYIEKENKIKLNEIKNIIYSGIKPTFKLITIDNDYLIATPEHEIMTKRGFICLANLTNNDLIMCDSLYPQKKNGRKKLLDSYIVNLWNHPFATKIKTYKDKRGYTLKIEKYRAIYEASINNITVDEYKSILRTDKNKSKKLNFINPKKYEIHHKDFNHYNNNIENLECLKIKDHKILHSDKNISNFNQGIPVFKKIKSIKYVGLERTFDIECFENHNFVANGIVIHNSGKTKTAVAITADRINLNQRVFVLTPQEEIFQQWRKAFAEAGIDAGYINSDGVQGHNKSIYVCMPLSLNNILSLLPERFKPDVIITDECHHSAADTWLNIYDYYKSASRLGLTATPQRTDGKGLDNIYTDIVQTITMQKAIDAEYLAQPLIIVPEQYQIEVPINNGDYDVNQQAELLGKPRIIGDIIKQYTDIFAGMPVLVACSTHEHAKIMTTEFQAAGWNFDHIHSKFPIYERRRLLREIRNGKLNGLVTVGIGIEGMDIPGLYGLIWLRRTLSITIYLQFTGRVLRPMTGKQYGIIIDPVGNTFIHGRPELPRHWKLTGRDDAPNTEESAPKMKLCPICSVMNAEQNIYCHICGFDFRTINEIEGRKRQLPVMIDGKLVILDADKLADRKEEIQAGLKEQREKRAADAGKEEEPRVISRTEKIDILKNGLEQKGGMFAEAIKNYL